MDRILFDVQRWNIYLHRRERKLPLVSLRDPALLKFSDEVFDRFFSGDARKLSDKKKDKKAAPWAERAHALCNDLPNFAAFAQACRGKAREAAEATQAVMEVLAPQISKTKSSAQQKEENEAHDAGQGLEDVEIGEGDADVDHEQQTEEAQKRIERIAELIKDDERLKRIALLAGKFKRILLTKQKSKVKHDSDEIADIEQGGEISRLLPSELVKLLSPRMKMAVMRDIVERKCLQYALQASEQQGRGPIILCVDKSGSMEGEKDVWATAIALALLDMAHRQRRTFIILGFDDEVFQKVVVRPGRPLPKEQLCVAPRGGTDIWNALTLALRAVETTKIMRRSDIVLITDGECDTSEAEEVKERAKVADVSILGIGIGLKPEAVLPWCDEAYSVTDMGAMPEDLAEAMFSI